MFEGVDFDQKRTEPSLAPETATEGGVLSFNDGINAQQEIQSVCLPRRKVWRANTSGLFGNSSWLPPVAI